LRDAETKNEALWKLYVFLSDGLFYTGLLAKLRRDHPCSTAASNHVEHLNMAQNIVVRSIRCAWKDWNRPNSSIELEKDQSSKELGETLELFVGDHYWFKRGEADIPGKVSAVKISQYLHGDDSLKCRDIRYKFDSASPLDEIIDGLVSDSKENELIKEIVPALGLGPEYLKEEEVRELIERLRNVEDKGTFLQSKAARGESPEEELKALWQRDLQ